MESFRSLSPDDQKSFVIEALLFVASQQFNFDLPQHFIELSTKTLAASEMQVVYDDTNSLEVHVCHIPQQALTLKMKMKKRRLVHHLP